GRTHAPLGIAELVADDVRRGRREVDRDPGGMRRRQAKIDPLDEIRKGRILDEGEGEVVGIDNAGDADGWPIDELLMRAAIGRERGRSDMVELGEVELQRQYGIPEIVRHMAAAGTSQRR